MDVFLQTDRLLLRRFTEADAELLVELDSDPEVMRYLGTGRPTPRHVVEQETLPRVLRHHDRIGGPAVWAAVERDTGDFLGWFELHPAGPDGPDEAELGYRLRRPAWGKGYIGGRAGAGRPGVRRVRPAADRCDDHGRQRRLPSRYGEGGTDVRPDIS